MAEDINRKLTPEEVAAKKKRRLQIMHMQEIEDNPFDAEDIAMFEMFDRLRWSDEKRRAYIKAQAYSLARKEKEESKKSVYIPR